MQTELTKSKLREFGLLVGCIFLFMGAWPFLRRGQDVRLTTFIIGAALLALGIAAPALLRKPYQLWMQLATVLGWINTRLILGIVFCIVFTPVALIMRLIGKDPMSRLFSSGVDTYRVLCQPRSATHMKRQF